MRDTARGRAPTVCVVIAAVAALAACGEEPTGIRMPLSGTGTTGTVYVLRDARFEIRGPTNLTIDGDSVTGDTLSAGLPAGDYTVELLPGWQVVRLPEGTPMTATLTSPNPQLVTVSAGSRTDVVFVFDVSGEMVAMTGDADLDIGFDVRETDGGVTDAGPPAGPTHTFQARDLTCTAPSPPCPTTEPRLSMAARTVSTPNDLGSATVTYLLTSLDFPPAGPDPDGLGPMRAPAAGLNLDFYDSGDGAVGPSAACNQVQPDFVSAIEVGHVGVDNALQQLFGTMEGLYDSMACGGMTAGCASRRIAEEIGSGGLAIMIEVSGLDSYTNDDTVMVTVYEGTYPFGAPVLDGMGRPAAGQAVNTTRVIGTGMPGDVFLGRLRVLTGLELPLPPELLLPAYLTHGELRADLAPTAITSGQVGGTYPVDDYVPQFEAAMPGIGPTVRSVLNGVADHNPDMSTSLCLEISMGLTFEGVPVTRM